MSSQSGRSEVRVFIPLDGASLRELEATGSVTPARGVAFAVTPSLRTVLAAADEEDLEYAALCDASDAGVIAAPGDRDPVGAVIDRRRIVVAADVDSGGVSEAVASSPESRVHLSGPVDIARVVSIHVGEPDGDDDQELSWYDVSELSDVVALLG